MRVKLIISAILVCTLVIASGATARAASVLFSGILVNYKGDKLTLMDAQGNNQSFNITKDTVVMSRAGQNNQLVRIRSGSRLSIMADGSTARTITVLEVPK